MFITGLMFEVHLKYSDYFYDKLMSLLKINMQFFFVLINLLSIPIALVYNLYYFTTLLFEYVHYTY